MTSVAAATPRARPGLGARAWAFAKRHALTVYAIVLLTFRTFQN